MLSALTGAYSIDVALDEAKVGVSDIKEIIARVLQVDQLKADPTFDRVSDFGRAITFVRQAENAEEIFDALHISDVDEVLDVMC
ncbi:hypothetical protein [Luteimonas huabeiensis]|uniref:hypothetical protein n=1 Tax=Luteimonas huabeiensis TaxID=1244513 RepID=UPI001267CA4F|nr:hypothetical protein [Luteimonas huabeiensis]